MASESSLGGFQASASVQGRQFAEQCDHLLAAHGFELVGRRRAHDIGVEIDQVAISPRGATIWFEYKGSIQGPRPGLLRTDTAKKAIANGALTRTLQFAPPFVVLTSHVPREGASKAMLDAALAAGYLDAVICVYDPSDTARLDQL